VSGLEAKPPRFTFYEHLDHPGVTPGVENIDQGNISAAMSGRISSRDNIRTPDVLGGSSLNNVSPFTTQGNNWTVMLSSTSSQGEKTEDLTDVELELHLAVRTVP
jgi:hypothetical protein